jgi:hypothetical protein
LRASAWKAGPGKWIQFFIGLGVVVGFIYFLMSEPVPQGIVGDVIRRNLDQDVQTTALFYMELDRMPGIEKNCTELTEKGKDKNPRL